MASVQFQIHTDKENATSTGLKMPAGGIGGGKSFQAAVFQAHKTPRPRRALGSVNEVHRVGGRATVPHHVKNSSGGSVSVNTQKPNKVTEKDFKLKQQQLDKENNVMRKGRLEEEEITTHLPLQCKEQKLSTVYCLPDIEYMPPPSPPRDEDEDILPVKERASTYVHKLLSWRPQCLFGTTPDSEDEEKERQHIMEELDNLPLPKHDDVLPPPTLQLGCEEFDLDSFLPAMDDVLLPYMAADDHRTSAEVTLPTLDDSVGLVPHVGSLEIMDQSLPSTSSH